MGRDCPGLGALDIERAFAELTSKKLVLGPDHRGGCYLIAFRIADRMVLLDRGKFIVSGTSDEMRDSTDPLVRQFVHGLTEGLLTERKRGGAYERDLLHGAAD